MSTGEGADTNGEKERATIRLVSEQVKGLERLTELGFTNLQRQMDTVANLPVIVAKMEAKHQGDVAELHATDEDQERRIGALERTNQNRSEWFKTHGAALFFTAILAITAIIGLLTQLH